MPDQALNPQDSRVLSWVLAVAAMAFSGLLLYHQLPGPANSTVSGSFGRLAILFVGALSLVISLPLTVGAALLNQRSMPRGQTVSRWRNLELMLVFSPPVVDVLIVLMSLD